MTSSTHNPQNDTGLMPVTTLVIWLGCLLVGTGGMVLHYPRTSPALLPETTRVQLMKVAMATDPPPETPAALPLARPQPARDPAAQPQPPTMQQMPSVPESPELTPVAAPNRAITMAIPVDGPVRIVDAREAFPISTPRQSTPSTMSSTSHAPAGPQPTGHSQGVDPAVQQITFGAGEGQQPTPEYPLQAALARQQGTVVVRFTVGTEGQVLDAEAIKPCHTSLLNQAAVRAVRDTWRFVSGPMRCYEVSIEFKLTQQ